MAPENLKQQLFARLADVGKALASGNRLELRDPTWSAGMPELTVDELAEG